MKRLLFLTLIFLTQNLWATVSTFDELVKIKPPILKADFFQALGMEPQETISLKLNDFSCQIQFEEDQKKITQYSLQCEKALPQHLLIKPKTLWKNLRDPSFYSSAKSGEFSIANPSLGQTFQLNSLGNIISFHQGIPWKEKIELQSIEKIMKMKNAPEASDKSSKKKAKK